MTDGSNPIPAFGVITESGETFFRFPVIDAAGHVTTFTTFTAGQAAGAVTMPNTIQAISTDNGIATASSSADTITLTSSGDNSIAISVNDRTITIAHNIATTSTLTATTVTLSFGDAFTITDYNFDNTGHQCEAATRTIQIPAIDVGSLTLSGYSVSPAPVSSMPANGDTVNQAIAKLAGILDNSTDTISTRISNITFPVSGVVIHGDGPNDIIDLVPNDNSHTAVLNRASYDTWGVIKISKNNDPGAGYVQINHKDGSNNAVTTYMPLITDTTSGTIREKWLPEATSSTKGAVIVDTAMSDSSTNPVENQAVKAYVDGINFNTKAITYVPQIENPDYGTVPDAPEYIDDTANTTTMTLDEMLAKIIELEAAITALQSAQGE